MIFLKAFLLAGLICMLFQVLLEFTQIKVPQLLLGGFILGAVLSFFGVTGALSAWGGAGFMALVVGAGDAVYNASLLAFSGDFFFAFLVLVLFAAVFALGTAASLLHASLDEKEEKQ